MQEIAKSKSRPGIRVSVEAHRRAKEAGLCISKVCSKALIAEADALEKLRNGVVESEK